MYQLEHEKTGALMIHLSNEDDNNCFGVAFRTTPSDSTGVAHILEHTALCGSERYQVRDPFFSMIKRSMKTFMNAFTASDWTMYPFSSQNEVDFNNLMRVYLDAAFFPSLLDINFKQEGHRLEFEKEDDPDSPLMVKGVVYNEMKGSMSSQSSVMHQSLNQALFPTNNYRFNSGGDPEEIRSLTHQQLNDFHKKYYHPSNSLFYTYGSFPLGNHLKLIDEMVLSKFNKANPVVFVEEVERYNERQSFTYSYPLNKEEDDGKRSQVALAWLACNIKEPLEVLSLQLVNLILLGHPGAPLSRKLLESHLGKSMADTTGFEDDILETYFSAGLQGVADEDVDKVEALIIETLEGVVKDGINQQQIDSAIHQIELDVKEISGGHYPYCLNLLFRFFSIWVHGGDPVKAIDFDQTMRQLKENIAKGPFLEKQIEKYLLKNPHRVKVVLKPDHELENMRDEKLKKSLEEIRSKLTDEEKQSIIEDALKLKKYQEEEEDLSCLPSLRVSDIPVEVKHVEPTMKMSDLNVTFYEQPTNGIMYFNWYFKVEDLPKKDRELMSVLGFFLTNVGAEDLSFDQMYAQVNRFTGGFSAGPVIEPVIGGEQEFQEYFCVASRALNENQGKLFELAKKMMGHFRMDETHHLQTLITQRANRLYNSVISSGHSYANSLAKRNYGFVSHVSEVHSGVYQLRLMNRLAEMSQPALIEASKSFQMVLRDFLRASKLSLLIVGEKEAFEQTQDYIREFCDFLSKINTEWPESTDKKDVPEHKGQFSLGYQREAWITTTPVAYVAQCFKVPTYENPDSPVLLVLSNLIQSCYLHGEIREKGGAYGGMAGYDSEEGVLTFLSYRDPHISNTLSVYEKALEWINGDHFSQHDVDEAILQTCSKLDVPVSPAAKAQKEYILDRKGKSLKMREQVRQKILSCTKEEIIQVAQKYLDQKSSVAVVTGEEVMKRELKLLNDSPLRMFEI